MTPRRNGSGACRKLARLLLSGAAAAIAASAPLTSGSAQPSPSARPLRVCADPDDLPFSSSAPGTPGLYVEFGQDLARSMGRDFEPIWSQSYFGKFTVRTTLLSGKCDAYIGLPASAGFMGPRLLFSKPFLRVGYVLVLPPSLRFSGLDDLKGKRVAVQFATPPQVLLASRDDITSETFLSPEEALRALARGEVDAAFIWGPMAGYVNRTALHGAYHLLPVQGPGMQWPVAIGFARNNSALRDKVDQAIATEGVAVHALQVKYGFPPTAPVALASDAVSQGLRLAAMEQPAAPSPAQESPPSGADTSGQKDAAAAAPAAQPAAASASAAEITAGRGIFDGTCAHCHGPNAVTEQRKINLRLLHHRYGDRMDQVFFTTVEHGRPDKGMPSWRGVFSQQDFVKILAFLKSVQTD